MEFGALVDGVYDVVHVPDTSIHGDELKIPPVFPSFQVTLPVGVVGELELSITVTVNVSAVPTTYDAGFGVTLTDVVWDAFTVAFTVRLDVPELVWCAVSPL
jgi:hypothetical protein